MLESLAAGVHDLSCAPDEADGRERTFGVQKVFHKLSEVRLVKAALRRRWGVHGRGVAELGVVVIALLLEHVNVTGLARDEACKSKPST